MPNNFELLIKAIESHHRGNLCFAKSKVAQLLIN